MTDAGKEATTSTSALEVESSGGHGDASQRSEDGRVKWSSRWAFWLAAVGAAVGLGNLWRFPWQCAKWGGGPFLIAYIFCLFTLGMPLLTQELALGQKHRSGDIESFGRMNWRLRGIGLASVIGTFGILSYYSVIIGMSLVFLFASMQTTLPYGANNTDWWATDVMVVCDYPVQSNCASEFSWPLYGCTWLVLIISFFCVWKGVLSASTVVKFTMPLPLLFLLILLIRSLTLEGSVDGIGQYLNFTKWDELSKNGVWDAAVGQCFFSLSVCMGVMTAYGSYNPIKQDVATDEKVISLLDFGTSLFAGFVVYTILGYLEHQHPQQTVVPCPTTMMPTMMPTVSEMSPTMSPSMMPSLMPTDMNMTFMDDMTSTMDMMNMSTTEEICYETSSWYTTASFGLVFSAYPVALTTFDTPGQQIFAVIFFLVLFLLGIDSAFSMVEALTTVIVDSDVGRQFNLTTEKTAFGICILAGLCSTFYCGGGGIYWLDIVDRYINNYGMVLLGICETTACGWFYALDRQEAKVGAEAISIYRAGYFMSLLFSLHVALFSDVAGVFVFIALICVAFYFARKKIVTPDGSTLTRQEEIWYIMGWEGTEELRDFMNGNVPALGDNWVTMRQTKDGEIKALIHGISLIWGFLIKYFIPVFLSFILLATFVEDGEHPYEGYNDGDLWRGFFYFEAMVIIVLVIAIFPQILKQTSDDTGMSPTGKGIGNRDKNMDSPRLLTPEPQAAPPTETLTQSHDVENPGKTEGGAEEQYAE